MMATIVTTSVEPTPARALPIIGGHLALDFANTIDNPLGPTRYDHVASYDDLITWSLTVAIVTEDEATLLRRRATRQPSEAATVTGHAHQLRDILNDVFGCVADRTPDLATRCLALRPFSADAVATAALDLDTEPSHWTWPATKDLGALLHPISWGACDLLTNDDLQHVKRCRGCPWLFLDRSKNHSRRWCDMADCGTVHKMQRYVARRSAARTRSRTPTEPLAGPTV